ncbi:hypothetical protein GJ496_009205 [Pomphorhynchus laevis]|nr:hypothetical protein GJ496_009205 [Pomphorhynchus laevis]
MPFVNSCFSRLTAYMDNVTNHQSLSLLNCQSTDDILSTECNPDNNTNKTVNMNVPLINTCLSTSAVNTSFRSQQCCINPLYNQTYSGHTQYLHQTSNLSHRSQSTLSNTISSNFSSSHPKEDSTVVSPSTALSTRKIINYISLTNDQAQQIHPSVLLYNQRCGNQIPTVYEPTVTIEKMNSNYGDSNDGNTNPSYSLIYMPSSPHYLPSSRSSNYHSISAIQPIQQKDQMRIDTQRSLFSTYDINCISNNNLRSPNIIETVAKFTDSIGCGSSISNSNDDSTSLSDYDPYGEENIIDSAQQTTLQDDPASSSSTGSNNNNNNGSVNATNKRIKRKSAWIPPPLLIPDKINSFSLYDPSLSANAVISTGTSIALPSSDQANNTTLTMDEYMNRYKYINYDKSSENASFYQSRHGQHPNSPHSTDSSSVFQNTRKRSVSFAERLPLCYKYQLIDMLSLECSSKSI